MVKQKRFRNIPVNEKTSTKDLLILADAIVKILVERGKAKDYHFDTMEYIKWYMKFKVKKDKDYNKGFG